LQQSFDRYDSGKGLGITVPGGTTVQALIHILKLDDGKVGMVSLNGVMVPRDQPVEEDAEIKIFQPISGG
jgi:sulfur carrier protein ThiS